MGKTRAARRFAGVELADMRPTRRHRLAIVPGILGTVYGVDSAGRARFFDYDYEAAAAYAGVTAAADPRSAQPRERAQFIRSGAAGANPGIRTRCVWVLAAANPYNCDREDPHPAHSGRIELCRGRGNGS
jgi:hypothetical protein